MTLTNSEYSDKLRKAINDGKVGRYVTIDREDRTYVTYLYRDGEFVTQANYDETGNTRELLGERSVSTQRIEKAVNKHTVHIEEPETTPVEVNA